MWLHTPNLESIISHFPNAITKLLVKLFSLSLMLMAQCKHFFHEPFVSTTAIAWLIMFEWQHNSLYKWQVLWRMEEKLVCKKDNFGNDRWFFDEDIRLPPLPPGLPHGDRLSYIRNLDLRPDDVIIAGYPRSGKTIETFALQIQISWLTG